ncbi:MAG: CDP-glycerol glycerophosphotransferase family protein [Coriobacteriales bacterium]
MAIECTALQVHGSNVTMTLAIAGEQRPPLAASSFKTGLSVELPCVEHRDGLARYELELGARGNLAAFDSGRAHFSVGDQIVVAPRELLKGVRVEADMHANSFGLTKAQGQLYLKVEVAWSKREATKEQRIANKERYYKLFRLLPLKRKKVFFESFSTRTFSDNPKAIYEELVSRGAGYECVWGLRNNKTDVGPGGQVVRQDSIEYWYHLATAKYIVSNFNQYGVRKRGGQVMVNSMHGVPLKHMGLSVAHSQETVDDMRRTFASWDYFVTPSDYMSGILRGEHFGFKGRFIEAGYPRNDCLIAGAADEAKRQEVRRALGVPSGKKMILWAPTWRTKQSFDLRLDLEQLERALGDEYVLVLRAHYLESAFVPPSIYSSFVLNGHGYENVNDMLFAADVLITDYSSIMFDYSLLLRPMVFFCWDYDEYMNEARGTYFDLRAEFPELVAHDTAGVLQRLQQPGQLMPAVQRFHEKFNQYDYGDASAKVVDALWPDTRRA